MAGYLRIEGIPGESKDAGHEGWINLQAVSQSLVRPMPAGASGSSRQRASVSCGSLLVTKELDSSTAKLIAAICDGTVFPTVQVDLCTSVGGGRRVTYFRWVLDNVYVSDYHVDASTSGYAVPYEDLSLNFEYIKWTYDVLNIDGNSVGKVESSWKVEEGTSG